LNLCIAQFALRPFPEFQSLDGGSNEVLPQLGREAFIERRKENAESMLVDDERPLME
jgi:hypothetical protein